MFASNLYYAINGLNMTSIFKNGRKRSRIGRINITIIFAVIISVRVYNDIDIVNNNTFYWVFSYSYIKCVANT